MWGLDLGVEFVLSVALGVPLTAAAGWLWSRARNNLRTAKRIDLAHTQRIEIARMDTEKAERIKETWFYGPSSS